VFKYNNWAVKVFHSKEKADREIDIIRSSTILRQNDIIFPHLMRYDNIRTLLKQTIIGWYQHLGLKQKLNNFIKNYKKYLHIQVLFMEYIPGVDLLEFCISKNEKWSPNLAEEVTLQMLKATMECHQAGFIHRDIKPENFMINITYKNNQEIISVKLVDFGLATPIICDKNKILR
jgi:serine/threonine protein kinase